ncbi:predicted protein [Lichtheimia corymbifera JMRC:FSU:9682]|uniref:Uncharacterized protein n=1 Tax=Lichtheimia corymbifera JMRC:FSU:9682 TaxID=1263082 RepID=A0A068RE79_9FUNG|nr:predicted protein [Lichtheimia corymbifera JMRC:FSU:9682]
MLYENEVDQHVQEHFVWRFEVREGQSQYQGLMYSVHGFIQEVSDLFNFHFFHSHNFLSLPPTLNCCPIQLQPPSAIRCPASTHHVNPATALIRLSLTEWHVHGVYTPLVQQHPCFLTLHFLLHASLRRSKLLAATCLAALVTCISK